MHHYEFTLTNDDTLRMFIDYELVKKELYVRSGDFDVNITDVHLGKNTWEGVDKSLLNGEVYDFSIFSFPSVILEKEEKKPDVQWLIYPNPSDDYIYSTEEFSQVDIYDFNGRKIHSASVDGHELDTSGIPAGSYKVIAKSLEGDIKEVTILISH
jgi:hypothetical protein